jgi:hypothetical protein
MITNKHLSEKRLEEILSKYSTPAEAKHIMHCDECLDKFLAYITHRIKLDENIKEF